MNLNHRQAMNNGLGFIWKLLMQRICLRGSQVRHEQTYEQVINKFKYVYLNSKNLGIDPDQDHSWLKTDF